MKTYKIIDEKGKYNIYYYDENGNLELKEFHSLDGIGVIRDGYYKDKKDFYNKMQFIELSKTDWYFTRLNELNINVPDEIIYERLAIRKKYDDLKNNL